MGRVGQGRTWHTHSWAWGWNSHDGQWGMPGSLGFSLRFSGGENHISLTSKISQIRFLHEIQGKHTAYQTGRNWGMGSNTG